MLSLPLLFCQQHSLVPDVTFTLHDPITILYTALVAEVSAAAALHVVAAMTQLDHVPARHAHACFDAHLQLWLNSIMCLQDYSHKP